MILWIFACTPAVDTDPTDTTDTTVHDTDVDTDVPIVDIDADGSKSDVDCDDYDPAIHPGAAETWNSTDDDCDGVVDGDGTFTGTATIDTTAIYEGNPYSWTLSCPTTLVRKDLWFTFAVVCTSDQGDARMVQLLGDVMEIHEVDNIASQDHFSGAVRVSSTDGWDADGSGTLKWVSFGTTDLNFSLDTRSLGLHGGARLTR
jgi:hypothetical protein